jgi:spermidine synthase
MRATPGPGPAHRTVVLVAATCFFLSGAAGLLYEVVWTRLLGLVFGHTVYAITTVLAAYMGGLALGSVLMGSRADRMHRPLRVYGLLEGAVGLYCLASPLLFRGADALYLWAHRALQPSPTGSAALHLVLSAALLLPPTTAMGATLPILSRAVVQRSGVAASEVGTLYGVNTWGAVLGTAATGFLLLPSVGLRVTIWIGVALNLGVAALALWLEQASASSPGAVPSDAETDAGAGAGEPEASRLEVLLTLVALGVSGAASMAYEISWTRALSLVLGSSTYAFSAMLTTFLVGLALGAVIVSRILRTRRPGLAALGAVEVGIAVLGLATLPALGRLPEAVLAVLRITGVSHGAVLGTQFLLGFAVMIVPTLLVGATFPLAIAAVGRRLARLGRDVGAIYGANTVGTIVGSIATGFVLIRAIGIERTVLAAAVANLAAGVALLLAAQGPRRAARAFAAAGVAAFALVAVASPHWDPRMMTTGAAVYAQLLVGRGSDALRHLAEERELLYYDEGISTTVSVARDTGGTTLTVNGKGDASNDLDMQTQLLCAHLGPLLAPEARTALVVGLASGVSVGAIAQHPLRRIDVAELEPAMIQASRFFLAENRNALADPRVRVIEGDGRSILLTAAEPYDVIVSEPSNPWIAGIASLFTLDFYRAARERLSPRGVFVQWLQNYSIFSRDMRMVVRTFQEVFPHVSIWAASPNDFLLVATPEPLRLDLGLVASRVAASPALREDFERFHWTGADLAYRFFLGEEDARRYAAGAPFNTDDLPILEFSAPLGLYRASPAENEETMRSFRTQEFPPAGGADPALLAGPRGQLGAARVHWLAGRIEEARHRVERAGPAAALDPALRFQLARMRLVLGDLAEADAILAAVPDSADPLVPRYRKAVTLLRDPAQRARLARRAGETGMGWSFRLALLDVFLELARERRDPDLYALAREQFDAELTVRPGSYQTMNNFAGMLLEIGDLPAAEVALRRAVQLKPDLAETQFNLGLVLEQRGQPAQAIPAYEAAARLQPGWPKPRQRLAALRGAARP